MSDTRDALPLLLIHGDRQAIELSHILTVVPALSDRFQVRHMWDNRPNETIPSFKVARTLKPEEVGHLQVLVEQERPSSDKVKPKSITELPSTVRVIRFPMMTMEALWPLRGEDPRLVAEPLYPDGRYPMSDRVAARLAGLQLTDNGLWAAYLRQSERELDDLPGLLDRDRQVWAHRDAICDVKCADFIEANLRHQQLFFNPAHQTGALSGYVAREVVRQALVHDPAGMEAALAELETVLHGYVGFRLAYLKQFPVNPLVTARLGLAWCSDERRFRIESNDWTFRDYIIRYIRWSHWVP